MILFLRTLTHISNMNLRILSNANCKTNEIKGMKSHNSAQSSLDDLTDQLQVKNCTASFIHYYYSTTN